jgi:hypothetical protein
MSRVQWTSIYPDAPDSAEADAAGAGAGGNDQYPGMPVGATPIHRDLLVAAAGVVPIWTPGNGARFILASAFISSDTTMRVALVDEADIQGSRPVDQYVAANGGSSPNLVPVPYPSKNVGNALRVVTSALGNVRIRVSGWEVQG